MGDVLRFKCGLRLVDDVTLTLSAPEQSSNRKARRDFGLPEGGMLLFEEPFGSDRGAGRLLLCAHGSVSVGQPGLLEQAESLSVS